MARTPVPANPSNAVRSTLTPKTSTVSIYTCRSSRLLSAAAISWLIGIVALGTLLGLMLSDAVMTPNERALWYVALGILAAAGIMFGIRNITPWLYTRFELRPGSLTYIGPPSPDGPNELSTAWEKLEVQQMPSGDVILGFGGQMIPVPQDLVDAHGFLTEIESRSRDRIPFPQIGWPGNIEHPRLDDRLLAEVQRGILEGKTMQMMKLVQEVTGIRSKECLDLVEKLRKGIEAAKNATSTVA